MIAKRCPEYISLDVKVSDRLTLFFNWKKSFYIEYCQNLSCQNWNFLRVGTIWVTIWVLEFYNHSSFFSLLLFQFLGFATFWGLSQFEILIFFTIRPIEFGHYSSKILSQFEFFELCPNLSVWFSLGQAKSWYWCVCVSVCLSVCLSAPPPLWAMTPCK